jgi:hypothetical protein
MQFRTSDLMITVLPKAGISDAELAKICLWHTRICTSPTFCHYRTCLVGATADYRVEDIGCPAWLITCPHASAVQCPRLPSRVPVGCGFANSCGVGGSACDPTVFCPGGSQDPWVLNDLEDLVVLRVELQEALKQLNELAKTLPSGIRSKADAEALKRGFEEVIKQVKTPKD